MNYLKLIPYIKLFLFFQIKILGSFGLQDATTAIFFSMFLNDFWLYGAVSADFPELLEFSFNNEFMELALISPTSFSDGFLWFLSWRCLSWSLLEFLDGEFLAYYFLSLPQDSRLLLDLLNLLDLLLVSSSYFTDFLVYS